MNTDIDPIGALGGVTRILSDLGRKFALVGGLAVSIRSEVRFTRDVDLALVVSGDKDAESVVRELQLRGYRVIALVEHETRQRLATIRLASPTCVVIDLLTASSGIEAEVVSCATPISIDGVGEVLVARAEELLALKVLAVTERRPQDQIDAANLLTFNPNLDLETVRNNLRLIQERGFDRGQDLGAKLQRILRRDV